MSERSMMAMRVMRYPQLVQVACARLASARRWRHLWRRLLIRRGQRVGRNQRGALPHSCEPVSVALVMSQLWLTRTNRAARRCREASTASNGLRLRDLFENVAFGLYADGDERDGSDQISESERVKRPAAEAVSEHEAHHRGHQERADAPDTEEPADGRGAQMGRVQLTDVDASGAVYAGIDPANQEGRDIRGKPCRHRKRQMKESADKKVQEQNRAAAIAIDQKTATRIAEEASDRLHQLESNGIRKRYPALRQDCRQHEQNAV